jgi:TatD DNase family protein
MNKYDFLIDTHCHLDFDEYHTDLSEVIERAYSNKVKYLITISTRFHTFNKLKAIVDKYANVYTTIGTHPLNTDEEFETYNHKDIISISKESKVVGIGECGLDYSRLKYNNKKKQEALFRLQIECSNESNLPFIIHNRDSDDDMERILIDESKKQSLNGVLHCFSSSERLADVAIDLGLNISFTGIITFKNAQKVRDIAKKIPIEKIFIETDSPFLAPEPFRGKRNEPSYVVRVLNILAEIKEISYDDIVNIVTANSLNFFNKINVNYNNE